MKARPLVTVQSLLSRPLAESSIGAVAPRDVQVISPEPAQVPAPVEPAPKPLKRRRIALSSGYVDPAGWEQLVRERTGKR